MGTFARCDLCGCYIPTLGFIHNLTIKDAEGTFKTDMIICKECSDDLHERYTILQSKFDEEGEKAFPRSPSSITNILRLHTKND